MNQKVCLEINWVIKGKLAIGLPPTTKKNVDLIKSYKIKSILSLCDTNEISLYSEINKEFNQINHVLPDHTYERKIKVKDILEATNKLNELILIGPTYIHCKAAVERSPLICISWLMKFENLSLLDSLIYLKDVHKRTNPLDYQLKLLKDKNFISWIKG